MAKKYNALSKSQLIKKIIDLENNVAKKNSSPSSKTIHKLKSNYELSPYYKNALNILAIVDKNAIIVDVNKVVKGLSKKDVVGTSILNFVSDQSKKVVSKNITKVFRTKRPLEYKAIGYGPNGQIAHYITAATPIFENNKVVAALLDVMDITKQETAANEIKQSEERFKMLSDSAFEGILIHQNGKISQINKAAERLVNYPEKDIVGQSIFKFIHPSCHQTVINKLKKNTQGTYESLIVRKGGDTFWAEVSVRELKYNGEAARVVAIKDITKDKQYKNSIEKSEFLYKTLINTSPDGILIHQNNKIVFINPVAIKLLEASNEKKLIGKNVYSFIATDNLKSSKARIAEVFKKKILPPSEVKIKTTKGNFKTIEIRSLYIEYEGKPAVLGVFQDQTLKNDLIKEQLKVQVAEENAKQLKAEINERKKIEDKLHSIFETTAHIIWTQDIQGRLTSYNSNFKKYIEDNYDANVSMGMTLTTGQLVSSKEYNEFWKEKLKKTMKGQPQNFEAIFTNRHGKTISHEIFLTPIKDNKKNVIEISAIAHDITGKKAAEELLKQSLKEKEILLKEVHHRVKNNLQLVSSILNLQSSYVSDDRIVDVLKDSQNRIKSMSFIHESLYKTKDFTNINFSEYISELSKNLLHSYAGYENNITLELDIKNVLLNLDLAIPCGLIINEILSNSFKYAFDKTISNKKLYINLTTSKNDLIIKIGDNGVGLDSKIDFKNTNSLGLQIVTTLIEQLNASIKLDKNKKGTNFVIQFNYNQIKKRI